MCATYCSGWHGSANPCWMLDAVKQPGCAACRRQACACTAAQATNKQHAASCNDMDMPVGQQLLLRRELHAGKGIITWPTPMKSCQPSSARVVQSTMLCHKRHDTASCWCSAHHNESGVAQQLLPKVGPQPLLADKHLCKACCIISAAQRTAWPLLLLWLHWLPAASSGLLW